MPIDVCKSRGVFATVLSCVHFWRYPQLKTSAWIIRPTGGLLLIVKFIILNEFAEPTVLRIGAFCLCGRFLSRHIRRRHPVLSVHAAAHIAGHILSRFLRSLSQGVRSFYFNCHCEEQIRGPKKLLLFGERTNGGTRSRHTYRICLPSIANEDDVAISIDKKIVAKAQRIW